MTIHNPNTRGILRVYANGSDPVAEVMAELSGAFGDFKKSISGRMDELEKDSTRLRAGGDLQLGKPDARAVALFASAVLRRDVSERDAANTELEPYGKAFAAYLRRGEGSMTPDVRAAMSVGSDPDGGYFVPPTHLDRIQKRLFESSPVRQLATAITIPTDAVTFPVDANDATTGGWVGETTDRTDTATPQIGEQTIYVREQYAQPKVTQKLLDMSTYDVEGWLNAKIADKLSRTENAAFVSGSGVSQPRGFLDYRTGAVTTGDATRAWGVLQYVATGASAGFGGISGLPGSSDARSLITLQAALKPQYRANAVWAMNRATSGVIRTMRDGNGRFLWVDSLQVGQPNMLLGSPVAFFEDMPAIGADTFSIAYGDFGAGYLIVDGPGIRVLRDPYTSKPYVKFYTTKWTGGDVIDTDAIKLLKFGVS